MPINEVKTLVSELISETTSREDLDKIAVIQSKLDECTAESEKQTSDYKDLLKDYASLVKSRGVMVDNPQKHDDGQKDFSFESFTANWEKEHNKK